MSHDNAIDTDALAAWPQPCAAHRKRLGHMTHAHGIDTMITINELWNLADLAVWENSLRRYWEFVKSSNIALEHRMEELNANHLQQLDATGWYEFLRDEYFRWKYTANNRYSTTTRRLDRYVNENTLDELHNIKLRLISLNPRDVSRY